MNYFDNDRPELDETGSQDWNLAFSVVAPLVQNTAIDLSRLSVLATSMPHEINPVFSIAEDEVTFSFRVKEVTQRQAVMIGFAGIVTAFENANLPLVVRSARIASRISIEQAMLEGVSIDMLDISLEVIDLERTLTSIRDLE